VLSDESTKKTESLQPNSSHIMKNDEENVQFIPPSSFQAPTEQTNHQDIKEN
jgi:hypothetical protein